MNKKAIRSAFFNYKKYRNIAIDSIVDYALSNFAVNYEKPCVMSSPTRKREENICKIIDKDDKTYKWCKVVEATVTKFYGTGKDALIKALYFDRLSVRRTAFILHMGKNTVTRWDNEILESAEIYAKKLGLL